MKKNPNMLLETTCASTFVEEIPMLENNPQKPNSSYDTVSIEQSLPNSFDDPFDDSSYDWEKVHPVGMIHLMQGIVDTIIDDMKTGYSHKTSSLSGENLKKYNDAKYWLRAPKSAEGISRHFIGIYLGSDGNTVSEGIVKRMSDKK